MPEFDKNAGYIWAIVLIGLITPLAMAAFAGLRLHFTKRRLDQLSEDAKED